MTYVTTKLLTIHGVEPGSPAAEAGVAAGSLLLSVNGRAVQDPLDLRFTETATRVDLVWRDGTEQSTGPASKSGRTCPWVSRWIR